MDFASYSRSRVFRLERGGTPDVPLPEAREQLDRVFANLEWDIEGAVAIAKGGPSIRLGYTRSGSGLLVAEYALDGEICNVMGEIHGRSITTCNRDAETFSDAILEVGYDLDVRSFRPQKDTLHEYFLEPKQT